MKTLVQIKSIDYDSYGTYTQCFISAQINIPKCTLDIIKQIPGFKKTCKNLPDKVHFYADANKFVLYAYGIARLKQGETFNEQIGKQIALLKAKKMLFKEASILYQIIANLWNNYGSNFFNLKINCLYQKIKCTKDLNYNKEKYQNI